MGWLFKGFNSLPRDFGAKNNQDGIETNVEHPLIFKGWEIPKLSNTFSRMLVIVHCQTDSRRAG
jgi:hypothetical protein